MTADAPGAERESGFDLPNVEEELVGVSERKRTRLGEGHFLTTATTYRLGDGTPVARYSHLLFRFTPAGDNDSA
jgi:hypothetical protein